MMKTVLTGILALAGATSAFAEDTLLSTATPERLPLTLSSEPQAGPGKDWGLAILLEVLLPPDGDVASGVEWKDAFSTGFGLRVELDRLWAVGGVNLGIFGAVGATMFGGEDFDFGGQTVEVDPLAQAIVVVGGKIAYRPPEGLQIEGRLGLGMVSYFATDADINGIATDVIDSSQEFFWELGGRVGFVAGSVVLQIGLLVRSQSEPEPSDPSTIDFEDALLVYGLDAGILIRF